jgi:hypothetical protein
MKISEEKFKRRIEKAKAAKQKSYQRHLAKQKSTVDWKRRDAMNEIRISNRSGSHVNCFRYFPNNTDAHEDRKFEVFKQLRKWKHEVIVEPIFNNGARGDVLDLDECIIYEIVHTETEARLASKEDYYSSLFEIRKVPTGGEFKEEMLL